MGKIKNTPSPGHPPSGFRSLDRDHQLSLPTSCSPLSAWSKMFLFFWILAALSWLRLRIVYCDRDGLYRVSRKQTQVTSANIATFRLSSTRTS